MVIHGMAGAGKTSLAAYFARLSENEERYPITVWLQANSEVTLDSSVVDATRMFDLTKGSDTPKQCLRALQDFLRNEKSKSSRQNLPKPTLPSFCTRLVNENLSRDKVACYI